MKNTYWNTEPPTEFPNKIYIATLSSDLICTKPLLISHSDGWCRGIYIPKMQTWLDENLKAISVDGWVDVEKQIKTVIQ